MGHVITQAAQGPDQGIVDHISPEVSDMSIVVDRGAAAVKADLSGIEGFKDLDFPAQGIIKGERHGTSGCIG
jgi:hypothetical protein